MDWHSYFEEASVIGGFATGVAAGFAIVAAGFAWQQIRSAARVTREAAAIEAYREYLHVCFDHPEYSSSAMFKKLTGRPDFKGLIDELSVESEKYLWHLTILLNACEQIKLYVPQSEAWDVALRAQFGYHEPALREIWPVWKPGYSPEIGAVLGPVLWLE